MSILSSQNFKDFNIPIYGTYEEPLFKAQDIGNLLQIKKIRDTLEKLDKDEKMLILSAANSGVEREQYFITENGLYEILFTSRKLIAKEFKKWIKNIIKEIRLTGKYEFENKIKEIDQEYKIQLKNLEENKNKQLEIKESKIENLKIIS